MDALAESSTEFRYAVIARRDQSFDGKFWFGVLTTGVFCRPGCAARTPLAKNVRFYDSVESALADGLRPCLRCRPAVDLAVASVHLPAMKKLCRFLRENCEQHFSNEDLANRIGLSESHFPKVFKVCIGVTAREYADACRSRRLRDLLKSPAPVGEAIVEAGYGSASRIYEGGGASLGMTPRQFKHGGDGLSISYAVIDSPLGLLLVAATDWGICWAQFGESAEDLLQMLAKEFPRATLESVNPISRPELLGWVNAINRHLAGDLQTFEGLPLDIAGTAFQAKVWKYLTSIPMGEVRSYTEVAEGIGHRSAVRAVATACATNRIAILIPCHRVLRGTGELAGYRWGLDRKRSLLKIEQIK